MVEILVGNVLFYVLVKLRVQFYPIIRPRSKLMASLCAGNIQCGKSNGQ